MLSAPLALRAENPQAARRVVFSEGLKFCEGTVPYRQMILVSNFGSDELDPLNTNGKGYIMAVETHSDEPQLKTFIPADGNLSGPKGMAVHEGRLFIADVGKVVVYNLRNLKEKPAIVKFPEGDDFVNDIVAVSDLILVSVTNTGRIYAIDASKETDFSRAVPKLAGNVPGANGMAVVGTTLYVASYNPSGTPSAGNVIYYFDLLAPGSDMQKLSDDILPGQYDGIAVSEDGTKLYFSSWAAGEAASKIYTYNLANKEPVQTLDLGIDFGGPADISIKGGCLWIPDLPHSTVYGIPL